MKDRSCSHFLVKAFHNLTLSISQHILMQKPNYSVIRTEMKFHIENDYLVNLLQSNWRMVKERNKQFQVAWIQCLTWRRKNREISCFFFSLHKVAIFRQFLKFTNRRERERERKVLRHLVLFKHVRKSSLHTEH